MNIISKLIKYIKKKRLVKEKSESERKIKEMCRVIEHCKELDEIIEKEDIPRVSLNAKGKEYDFVEDYLNKTFDPIWLNYKDRKNKLL